MAITMEIDFRERAESSGAELLDSSRKLGFGCCEVNEERGIHPFFAWIVGAA